MSEEIIKLYDSQEVAEKLHIGVKQVNLLTREGKLTAKKVGKRYLYTAEAVNKYIQSK